MDFRTDLGKEVVVVDIRAPHCLIHISHEPNGGVEQHGTGLCSAGKHFQFFGDFFSGPKHGVNPLAWNTSHAARTFKRAHQCACAEVIHKIVLVKGGLESHPRLCNVCEEDGHLRTIAQKPYPRKVLTPT